MTSKSEDMVIVNSLTWTDMNSALNYVIWHIVSPPPKVRKTNNSDIGDNFQQSSAFPGMMAAWFFHTIGSMDGRHKCHDVFLAFLKTSNWQKLAEKRQWWIQLRLWWMNCSASSKTWRHTSRTGSSSGKKSHFILFEGLNMSAWYVHFDCVLSGLGKSWKRFYKVGCRPAEKMTKWRKMQFVRS